MKIEHICICVPRPIEMAEWYRKNLGFRIVRTDGNDSEGVAFVIDSKERTVLELAKSPDKPAIGFDSLDPVQLHLGIECNDPSSEAERLVAAGASHIGECPMSGYPGEKVFIRDPWGVSIQLLNRKEKLR